MRNPLAYSARARYKTNMISVLMILNVFVCIALIVLVLMQKSDPASGGMFGGAGGTTQTVVRNPLARPTAYLAAIFLILTLVMAIVNKGASQQDSIMQGNIKAPAERGSIMPTALPAPQPLAIVEPSPTDIVTDTVSESAISPSAVRESVK
jgi:preprotein translocase subunit SecG